MKKLAIYILLAVTVTACDKPVMLDLKQVESKVVIEGLVADKPGYQYVKVSRTTDFYNVGGSPRVTDATVVVSDNLGNTYSFTHNPNEKKDSLGYYVPETPFIGVVGRTYTLTVVVDGVSYEAVDHLNRITTFDGVEVRVDEDEKSDPEDEGRFYEVLLFVSEPKDTKDYYLLKSFRNGKLEFDSESDVYYADDELIGEKIDGIPMPIYYAENDKAKIEFHSLSREAFIFYRDLSKLLNNDGGMFSPPPADPRNNISNGALGFFQTSAISIAEIDVKL